MKEDDFKEGYENFIKVSKWSANKVIGKLRSLDKLSKNYKIHQMGDDLYIPFENLGNSDIEDLNSMYTEIIPFQKAYMLGVVEKQENKPKSLKEALKEVLPHHLHEIVPTSFDVIGKIAIIDLNREELEPLRPFAKEIGKVMLKLFPNLSSVFEKQGDVSGVKRLRTLNLVAGKNNTTTIYKENGTRFWVDVENTFFTPRLSYERDRVAKMKSCYNQKGRMWDVFCGVGPYTLQIAEKNPELKCIGTDINCSAIKLAKKNLSYIEQSENVEFYCLNVKEIWKHPISEKLKAKVSRMVMNLPKQNLSFLELVRPSIHPEGCLLHIYQFNESDNPLKDAREKFQSKLNQIQLKIVQEVYARVVKPYSPALVTTCLDVIIKRDN